MLKMYLVDPYCEVIVYVFFLLGGVIGDGG